MNVEKIKISELKPLENNVRKHPKAQIQELIRSYQQFGQTRPIVIDENNNILIGNGFYQALLQLGIEDIEAYRISNLSDIEKKKLILSDNRTFTIGIEDYDTIENYIKEITDTGDFNIAGYDEDVVRDMMKDIEQITSDMNDFGTISQNTVNDLEKQDERMSEKVSEIKSQNVNEVKGESHRTVICPSCGEVIVID